MPFLVMFGGGWMLAALAVWSGVVWARAQRSARAAVQQSLAERQQMLAAVQAGRVAQARQASGFVTAYTAAVDDREQACRHPGR